MLSETLSISYILIIYLLPRPSQEYHAICTVILIWSNSLMLLSYTPQRVISYHDWMLFPEKKVRYHKEYLMILSSILTFIYAFLYT
jgi:hypothetical protein